MTITCISAVLRVPAWLCWPCVVQMACDAWILPASLIELLLLSSDDVSHAPLLPSCSPFPAPCLPRTHLSSTLAVPQVSCPSRAAQNLLSLVLWCRCCAAYLLAAWAGCCAVLLRSRPCQRAQLTSSRHCCPHHSCAASAGHDMLSNTVHS